MGYSIEQILKNIFEIKGLICICSKETNVNLYDFDFRQYFDTRVIISETKHPVILRVGAIQNYSETYREFEKLGLKLINSIEQHEMASLLPRWYPHIEKFTAKSKFYEVLPQADEIMREFEFPIFLKGERQTSRHKRSLCIAESKAELENIIQLWGKDPILNWQRVICREFIRLEKIDNNIGDQLQFSNEHRVFLWRNRVVGIGQYWVEARKIELKDSEKNEIKELGEKIAQIVNVPFLVVDIAKQENGNWMVIELNDAQESGYAGISKLKLWDEIIQIENERHDG